MPINTLTPTEMVQYNQRNMAESTLPLLAFHCLFADSIQPVKQTILILKHILSFRVNKV